ncbi:hypothetical protein EDC04DRAFT_2770033 [Pisolithus marmoratus]|nr:hypothetical protein EDC04DRAFT_2770033 [Pisolithus marmoratus]
MSVTPHTVPSIRVSGITVKLADSESQSVVAGVSVEVIVGDEKHKLLRVANGTLRATFTVPIVLSQADRVRLSVCRKYLFKPNDKTRINLDIKPLFIRGQGYQPGEPEIRHAGMRIIFGVCPEGQPQMLDNPVNVPDDPPIENLQPTTERILQICPRFRILVIGKTGVGKSTLINRAFGVAEAVSAHDRPGKANIETELTSPENSRFVLHDSLGFEAGENENYETAKGFIRNRRSGALKDQLHAVWFCFESPCAGARLLETAAEDFLKSKQETLGTIPLIIVFTKYDEFVDEVAMKIPDEGLEDEDLTEISRTMAEPMLNERCVQLIHTFAGEALPHVAVSIKGGYEDTLPKLVQLTYSMVSERVAHEPSVVSNMAQRVNPDLKIQGSIDIGKKKYWKTLRRSPNFNGHTMWDCLYVIHTDIVQVWNFSSTAHLLSKEFRELMVKMVEDLHVPNTVDPASVLTVSGGTLVAAISGVLAAVTNPAAPIVIPIIAGLALGAWVYAVYQHSKVVQQRFIAFIVDLTHVMEILFIITQGRGERLGRRAIKLAYNAYNTSGVKALAHDRIASYRELPNQDTALEMIENLIKPGSDYNANYHADLRTLALGDVDLSQDEPW